VAEGDPADRVLAAPEDLCLPALHVEAQRRTEPYLHVERGSENRVVESTLREVPLHGALGGRERTIHFDMVRKGDVDEPARGGEPTADLPPHETGRSDDEDHVGSNMVRGESPATRVRAAGTAPPRTRGAAPRTPWATSRGARAQPPAAPSPGSRSPRSARRRRRSNTWGHPCPGI